MDVVLNWLYELYCYIPGWLFVDLAIILGLALAIWLTMRFVQKESARTKIKQILKSAPDSSIDEIARATGLSEAKAGDVFEDLMIEYWADEEARAEKNQSARAIIKLVLKSAPDSSAEELAKATGLSIEVVEDLIDDDDLYESLKMERASGD